MADFGLFVGWGPTRAGREMAATRVFDEAVAYWNGLKASGDIESLELVMLGAHGGDLVGFALLRGDREKLARLRMTPEFARITSRAEVCLESVGVVDAYVDGGVMQLIGLWTGSIADLV